MTRRRAASIHLSLSALVCTALFLAFWFVLYPSPLFTAVGGREIFLVLLCVDMVLGPLLTLIVFQDGKKYLRFDLAAIAVVQLVALAYGVHTLWAGRPVYLAALGHRFDVVMANEVNPEELVTAKASLPWFGPEWVGTALATDGAERERIVLSALAGADYGHFPQHHVPLATMRDEMLAKSRPIASLTTYNPGRGDEIRLWLNARGANELNTVFQGLRARSEDMTVILDKRSGDVIGIAPFKPWD
jgi:hypothetical protein